MWTTLWYRPSPCKRRTLRNQTLCVAVVTGCLIASCIFCPLFRCPNGITVLLKSLSPTEVFRWSLALQTDTTIHPHPSRGFYSSSNKELVAQQTSPMFIHPATKSLHGSHAVKMHCTDNINYGHVLHVPVKPQWHTAICKQFAGYAKPVSALSVNPQQGKCRVVSHFAGNIFANLWSRCQFRAENFWKLSNWNSIIHYSSVMFEHTDGLNCYSAPGKELNSALLKYCFLLWGGHGRWKWFLVNPSVFVGRKEERKKWEGSDLDFPRDTSNKGKDSDIHFCSINFFQPWLFFLCSQFSRWLN